MAEILPLDHGGPTGLPATPFGPAALDGSVMDRFGAMVADYPDRIALSDATLTLTYRQLGDRVRRLARDLVPLLPADGAPVAILLGHAACFPMAMLAVLAAGRGYVPLDASFPVERNRQILGHAGVGAIVTDTAHRAAAAGLIDVPILDIDAPAGNGSAAPLPTTDAGDLAYISYTSGTTGTPKGVFVSQRNLLHDVMQYANAIHLSADDRLSLLYSPSVVGAIRDIYGALLTGASLHVVSPRDAGADGLCRFLRERRVTVCHAIPIVFRHLVAQLATDGGALDDVRLVYLAGDRIDRADVLAFQRQFSRNALLYTGVGASEVATIYAHWFITTDTAIPEGRVPVGRPIPDRRFALLDNEGQPVPPGEPGEIVVSSAYISLGYWRDPAITARVFSDDPDRPGVRRYRTGDLGRMNAEGMLVHLGRKDHQVKLHGHRIELVEIEATLKAHLGVAEAAVLIRGSEAEAVLVAYWIAGPVAADTANIRAFLAARLPAYMVPPAIIQVAALPLLPNFKIDRAALARHDRDTAAAPPPAVAAMPEGLAAIAATFARVLQRPVGPDDDFFLSGGDSLGATRVAADLESLFRRRVSMGLLATARSPRQVWAWSQTIGHGETKQLIELSPVRLGTRPAVHLMSQLGGAFWWYRALTEALPADHAYLGALDRAVVMPEDPADTIPAIAADVVAVMWAAGTGGPFRLLGYSFGGKLAYEVASQLVAAGAEVSFVGLIDTPSWRSKPPRKRRINPITAARRRASATYDPPPLAIPVTLFKAADSWPDKPGDYGWSRFAAALTIVPITGSHSTIQQPEHLPALVDAVTRALATTEESPAAISAA